MKTLCFQQNGTKHKRALSQSVNGRTCLFSHQDFVTCEFCILKLTPALTSQKIAVATRRSHSSSNGNLSTNRRGDDFWFKNTCWHAHTHQYTHTKTYTQYAHANTHTSAYTPTHPHTQHTRTQIHITLSHVGETTTSLLVAVYSGGSWAITVGCISTMGALETSPCLFSSL